MYLDRIHLQFGCGLFVRQIITFNMLSTGSLIFGSLLKNECSPFDCNPVEDIEALSARPPVAPSFERLGSRKEICMWSCTPETYRSPLSDTKSRSFIRRKAVRGSFGSCVKDDKADIGFCCRGRCPTRSSARFGPELKSQTITEGILPRYQVTSLETTLEAKTKQMRD
jgi:hypothetical protein